MQYDIKVTKEPVKYEQALAFMNIRKQKIISGKTKSLLWLLEHEAIYTAGNSADDSEIVDGSIHVSRVDRGGKITYHGPGQRIGYVVFDLKQFNGGRPDIREFVSNIEYILIETLGYFGIESFADRNNVGIWTNNGNTKAKIASIGIKVGQKVTTHGFALNVSTDLSRFDAIVPCGIREHSMCSIASLKATAPTMSMVDMVLLDGFKKYFA